MAEDLPRVRRRLLPDCLSPLTKLVRRLVAETEAPRGTESMREENKHEAEPDANAANPRREAVVRRLRIRIWELESYGLTRSSADDLLWVLCGALSELTSPEAKL